VKAHRGDEAGEKTGLDRFDLLRRTSVDTAGPTRPRRLEAVPALADLRQQDHARCGVPLADAVASASSTPAAVLGRTDIGALEGGRRADLVVVDDDLAPLRVMLAGRWA